MNRCAACRKPSGKWTLCDGCSGRPPEPGEPGDETTVLMPAPVFTRPPAIPTQAAELVGLDRYGAPVFMRPPSSPIADQPMPSDPAPRAPAPAADAPSSAASGGADAGGEPETFWWRGKVRAWRRPL